MSVDTTVLILECTDGFRVAIVQAAENITHFRDEQIVKEIYSEIAPVPTLEEARLLADKEEKNHTDQMGYPSEYGIRIFKWDSPI